MLQLENREKHKNRKAGKLWFDAHKLLNSRPPYQIDAYFGAKVEYTRRLNKDKKKTLILD